MTFITTEEKPRGGSIMGHEKKRAISRALCLQRGTLKVLEDSIVRHEHDQGPISSASCSVLVLLALLALLFNFCTL